MRFLSNRSSRGQDLRQKDIVSPPDTCGLTHSFRGAACSVLLIGLLGLVPLAVGCSSSQTTSTVADEGDPAEVVQALEAANAKLRKDGQGMVIEVDARGVELANETIQGLKQLKKLRSLKSDAPEFNDYNLVVVGSIPSLVDLDLRGCGITDEGIAALESLTNLKALRLSGKTGKTDVTDKCFHVLGRLPSLQVLAIDFLKFAGGTDGITALKDLPLRELYASNTLVNDECLELMATQFPELAKLRASGCQVSNAGLQSIAKMTQLVELDLSENTSIFDDGMAHLSEMTQLKKLNLWRVPITDEGVASLAGLTNMEWLNLDNTAYLSDDGLKYLSNMTQLKFLHLGSTSVTDEGMPHLTALKALEDLKVTRTGVTDAGVQVLKKSLPETRVQLKYEGGEK